MNPSHAAPTLAEFDAAVAETGRIQTEWMFTSDVIHALRNVAASEVGIEREQAIGDARALFEQELNRPASSGTRLSSSRE